MSGTTDAPTLPGYRHLYTRIRYCTDRGRLGLTYYYRNERTGQERTLFVIPPDREKETRRYG